MAVALPKGFTPLDVAPTKLNIDLNIIGVVTDHLPPVKSRGEDYMCSFTLCDQSSSPGQLVKFFRPTISALPRIGGNGDVVILRQVQTKSWSGLNSIISNRYSSWAVIHGYSIPANPSPSSTPQISKLGSVQNPISAELLYGMNLGNALSHHRTNYGEILPTLEQLTAGSHMVSSREGPKFALIKDVEERKFYNIVGEVIKIWPSSSGGFEIYVSDYTSNPKLFNYEWGQPASDDGGRYGDEFNYIGRKEKRAWPGPYGRLTLEVILWPPHSIAAQSTVNDGDYVELRNVKMKLETGRLEGVIHTDRKYPDRVDVHVLNTKDDRVKDVLRAKRSYLKKFEAHKAEYLTQTGNTSKRENDQGDEQNDPPRKKQKNARSKQEVGGAKTANLRTPLAKGKDESRAAKELAQKEKMEGQKKIARALRSVAGTDIRLKRNKNVACAHPAIPITPVSEILAGLGRRIDTGTDLTVELPFQNVCCRARVRVIDFFPPKLEDFAVPCDEFEDLSDHSDDESGGELWQRTQLGPGCQRPRKWEWMFCLLLQDATARTGPGPGAERETIKALISDKDAQYLLRMDATDLRRDPDSLGLLREKLFILWGDLEERKSAFLGSPPKETNLSNEAVPVSVDVKKKMSPTVHGRGVLVESSALPFECCLKEYGILEKTRKKKPLRDAKEHGETWLRRFQMFGTSIT